jgi:regulator of sigma E protease
VSVLYFLLMVGVLVTVHELGHFLAAKALGIKVLRFSLGFGPAIARLRGRDTEYQISIIPLGGYVRMLGEDPGDQVAEEDADRAFSQKPLWRRLIVVFAGPAANLICPLVIYFAFFAGHTELPAAVIGDVFEGSPAAAAGLRPGDRVLEIDGEPVRYWEELEQIVDDRTGKMLRFRIQRGTQEIFTYVAPRRHVLRHRNGFQSAQGLIGVTQAPFQPQVGILDASSAAARAGLRTGDLVISVDGEAVDSYSELAAALANHSKRAAIAYLRAHPARLHVADVHIYEARMADLIPELGRGEGGRMVPVTGFNSAEFFVATVTPGSPAERAGLRPGDLITTLDGVRVTHWILFDQALQAQPEKSWRIGWRRAVPGGGVEEHEAAVRQTYQAEVDEYGNRMSTLVFGAVNDFHVGQGEMVPIEGRFTYAASHAFRRTGETILEMARGLAALVGGKLPRDTFGGPIMVYRMASVSGAKGWDSFLMMVALISINLGLINLLPVPILDGGNLVLFAIEFVRRRALSARVREYVMLSGLIVIIGMTLLALRNDIVRYLLS